MLSFLKAVGKWTSPNMVINPERRRLGTPKTKATLEERAEGTSRVGVKGVASQTTAMGQVQNGYSGSLLKKMKTIRCLMYSSII